MTIIRGRQGSQIFFDYAQSGPQPNPVMLFLITIYRDGIQPHIIHKFGIEIEGRIKEFTVGINQEPESF